MCHACPCLTPHQCSTKTRFLVVNLYFPTDVYFFTATLNRLHCAQALSKENNLLSFLINFFKKQLQSWRVWWCTCPVLIFELRWQCGSECHMFLQPQWFIGIFFTPPFSTNESPWISCFSFVWLEPLTGWNDVYQRFSFHFLALW